MSFDQLKYVLEFQVCPVLIRFLHQMDIWSSTCEQFCAESDDFRKKEQKEREQILSQERGTFSMEGDNDVPKSAQRQSPLAVINLEDVTHGDWTIVRRGGTMMGRGGAIWNHP